MYLCLQLIYLPSILSQESFITIFYYFPLTYPIYHSVQLPYDKLSIVSLFFFSLFSLSVSIQFPYHKTNISLSLFPFLHFYPVHNSLQFSYHKPSITSLFLVAFLHFYPVYNSLLSSHITSLLLFLHSFLLPLPSLSNSLLPYHNPSISPFLWSLHMYTYSNANTRWFV